jgi:hypothetical protein
MSLSRMLTGGRKPERQRAGALRDAGANTHGSLKREASRSAVALHRFWVNEPSAKTLKNQSFFPVSFSYASRYFALVLATTTSGSFGPGGVLSHVSVSR